LLAKTEKEGIMYF